MTKQKILVVGSGISGATIARILADAEDYEVTVFEKETIIGGACSDNYSNNIYKQNHEIGRAHV